jgi:DNA-binding CsgD family transcriptional regulator
VAVEKGTGRPFIGRAAELEHIALAVASAASGDGRLLLLAGEAGIGKTRLLGEALALAGAHGMATFRARAEELDRRRPFATIAACLGIAPGSTGPGHAEAARLLSDTTAPPSEFAVIEALTAVVEHLCAGGPVAIAVDDLQWADPSSLQVLHSVSRTADQYPLLLCGTLRPSPRPPEVARLLLGAGAGGGSVIAVPPLARGEVTELLASVLDVAPGPRLVRQADVAGGNAFYVTELVAALRASGSLTIEAGVAEIGSVTLPPALTLTVLLELSFLEEDTQEALRTASVLGSSFTAHDLGLVMNRTAVMLAPALREALTVGVLEGVDDRLAFRHDLVREALYEDMPLSMRMSMHSHVAGVLAARGAPAIQVAEHFVRGASKGDAVALDWLRRAADEATVRAPASAADFLARAADLFDPDDPGRDALLADRVVCLEVAARPAEAERECVGLLGRPQPPQTEAKLRLHLARHLLARGEVEQALRQASLAEAVEGLTPGQRARAVGSASAYPLSIWRFDLAEPAARRGLEMATAIGEFVARANCAFTLASVSFHRARYGECLAWAEKAQLDADPAPENRVAQGWQHLRCGALLLMSQALLRLDRIADATATLRQAREDLTRSGHRGMLLGAQSLVVGHDLVVGEWDDAISEFDALLDQSGLLARSRMAGDGAAGARALIALHRGDTAGAEATLATAAGADPARSHHMTVLARSMLAEATDGAGAALDVLTRGWDSAGAAGVAIGRATFGPDLVRLALAAGDVDRARAVCDGVDEVVASNPPAPSLAGTGLRCRGLLTDDPALLAEAAAVFDGGPRPLSTAHAFEDAADALARAGDAAGARRCLDRALQLYEGLDATWDTSRATSRLRAAGVRVGSREARVRPVEGWEALTRSQRAVVELVAQGHSNPVVAERLFLSRHTVKTHLTSAMRKLGISSRMDLVRLAADR